MAPSMEPHKLDAFPYTTDSWDSDDKIIINNKKEFWEFLSLGNAPIGAKYTNGINVAFSPNNLRDRESFLLIQRYSLSKEMGVAPFPGSFGEQPAYWLDAYTIIQHNLDSAQERKSAKEKLKESMIKLDGSRKL